MCCLDDRNGMGCFVRGGKNCMGCFVQGDKSMWDILSGVSKNGMGCFVLGCFVLHSSEKRTLAKPMSFVIYTIGRGRGTSTAINRKLTYLKLKSPHLS